jgi:hypothetical protein
MFPSTRSCYHYARLKNKGYLTGGLLDLERQHDSPTQWENFPRIGIGIAYANIPGTNFKRPDPEDEEAVTSDHSFSEDFYQ